jgi:glucosamine--fructose-6-phosphate aminotransferase (isomerizing)
MCGIFGSFNASKFEVLDQANRQRGNFASGLLYHDDTNYDIQKTEGCFDWNVIKLPNGLIYLGHNQAPTSTERVWRENNCHPFITNNWAVAHNGVLTNFDKLKRDYLPDHTNGVDSSIIPALFSHFEKDYNEIDLISHVLSMIEGTFGLWIVNCKSLNIYVARQGSTLFYDKNSFSSVKGTDMKDIKEGVIYKFNKKGIKSVGNFNIKSPFLEL